MTKRQFVVLAFRLYAVYSAIILIEALPWSIRSAFMSPYGTDGKDIIQLILTLAVPAWVIYFLWFRGEWLMKKMFESPSLADDIPQANAPNRISELDEQTTEVGDYYDERASETMERTVIGLIGLWLLTTSIPYLFYSITTLFPEASRYPSHTPFSPWHVVESLITPVGKILVGVWLTIRPWQLQQLLWRLRTQRSESPDVNPDAKNDEQA